MSEVVDGGAGPHKGGARATLLGGSHVVIVMVVIPSFRRR